MIDSAAIKKGGTTGNVTISLYDSLFGDGKYVPQYETVKVALKDWYFNLCQVAEVLKPDIADDFICLNRTSEDSCRQQTLSDCTVWTLTNALMLAKGSEPVSVTDRRQAHCYRYCLFFFLSRGDEDMLHLFFHDIVW